LRSGIISQHKTEGNNEEDEMKKIAIAVLSLVMGACLASLAFAQRNPRGSSMITVNGKVVSVDYGRPALKGRTIDDPTLLGQLPGGGFWRMGDNTSTTFKTEIDLAFDDVTVPAGEYSLWMQRQEDNSWKLVFNKQHGQWGTQHDPSQDLASVPMKETKAPKPVELVTITLTKADGGGTITVRWGTLETVASFKAK
jgi:hypothetical protein